jgi:hypothetical protein
MIQYVHSPTTTLRTLYITGDGLNTPNLLRKEVETCLSLVPITTRDRLSYLF